jgi:hypothetical protein
MGCGVEGKRQVDGIGILVPGAGYPFLTFQHGVFLGKRSVTVVVNPLMVLSISRST